MRGQLESTRRLVSLFVDTFQGFAIGLRLIVNKIQLRERVPVWYRHTYLLFIDNKPVAVIEVDGTQEMAVGFELPADSYRTMQTDENSVGSDQSWTPLWRMIVTSTLWGESKEVKILFVTMLALKDQYGKVTATTAGLSRLANLTYEETVKALRVLEAPDERSDTNQEYEGRRIKRVEGGWMVLNHGKYKGMIRTIERRKYQAEWQADERAIQKAMAEGTELEAVQLSAAGWKRYQKAKARAKRKVLRKLEVRGELDGRAEGVDEAIETTHARIARENAEADGL